MYRQYVNALGVPYQEINKIEAIPFLPISLFKTHTIKTTLFEPEAIFESSGTTGVHTSRHFVKSNALYKKSFSRIFRQFYGNPSNMSIVALLPGYLERKNSSLVQMAKSLIEESQDPQSGFYLYDHQSLADTLIANENKQRPTLLLGVTHALLDFAEKFPLSLKNTIVMETGGMKGKRDELTREEVHDFLKQQLGVGHIHSEYGMTELLSQAYSQGEGLYQAPNWMRILLREYNDPLSLTTFPVNKKTNGLVNIIDLANLYSCCFIATDDVGRIHPDGHFEILGRRDSSDLRGCSLMTVK